MKFLLVVLTSLFLAGCSKGGGGSPSVEETGYIDYSCDFSPDDGEKAPAVSPQSLNYEKASFSKVISRSSIEAIALASGKETINFAISVGALFYRVVRSPHDKCLHYSFLPLVPPDLEKEYIEAEKDLKKNERILGVYLPQGKPGLPTNANQAGILVREDSNRWTLVHELMHHLFELGRRSQNAENEDNLMKRYLAAHKVMKETRNILSLGTGADTQKVLDFQKNLIVLMESEKEVLTRFALEEMAIEKIMQTERAKGKMTYMPDRTRSSSWYITRSYEAAKEEIDYISDLARSNYLQLVNKGLVTEADQLDLKRKEYRAPLVEMSEINSKFGKKKPSGGPLMLVDEEMNEDFGCSRGTGLPAH